jgi:hypothetical protein
MSGAVKLFLGLFFLMFFLITIVPFLMVLLFFIISIVFTPYSTTPQTTTYYPENTATPNEYYSQNPVIGEALKEGNYGELITLKLNDAVKMKNTIYTSSYLKFTGIGEDSFSYYQQNQSQTPNASFFLFEDNKISITTSLQEKESTKQLFPQLTDIIYLQEIHKEATQAESYTVITKEPRDLVYPNIDKDTLQIYEWRKLTPNTLSPASCEDLCDAKAVCAYEGNPNDLSCRRTITSFGQEYPLNFYTCSGGTVAEEDKNSFYCCCRK